MTISTMRFSRLLLASALLWIVVPSALGQTATSAAPPTPTSSPTPACQAVSLNEIAEALAPALRDEARPVVIWSDPEWTAPPDAGPLTFSSAHWREEIAALPDAFGPRSVRENDDYTEVIFCSGKREVAIRSRFGYALPPSFFSSPTRKGLVLAFFDLIRREVRISGDLDATNLVDDSRAYALLFETMEARSALGEIGIRTRHELSTGANQPTAETIKGLAAQVDATVKDWADVYSVKSYHSLPYSTSEARKLLATLKEDPYGGGDGVEGRQLVAFGKPALPILLEELGSAEDYYYNCLVEILAGIPAAERDAAFLRELRKYDPAKDVFLDHWFIPTMLEALAKQKCREAIPIARRLAEATDGNIAANAKVALNLLGASAPARRIDTLVEVDPAIQQAVDAADVATSRGAAYAVIDQVFLPSGPRLLIKSVKPNKAGGHDFGGRLSGKGGWDIQVGARQGDLIPVSMRYVRGGLDGAGFAAVLRNVDGRWLVVWYRMLWIS